MEVGVTSASTKLCPPVSSKWNVQSVHSFAPREDHPSVDTPPSGAGVWKLARLASWGQPAARLLQDSHQGLLLNNHHFFLLPSVVASEATKTNAASSEGGRGWSVARDAAIFTSKTLARFGALAHNQARGGRMETQCHPPSARPQVLPAFSSDPTSKPSWGREVPGFLLTATQCIQTGLVEMQSTVHCCRLLTQCSTAHKPGFLSASSSGGQIQPPHGPPWAMMSAILPAAR